MKIENYKIPKSSFLSLEKDLKILVDLIFSNNRLKKLLYYTTPDCLEKPVLTDEQSAELFGKSIKLVPKLLIDENVLNYIIINFDIFTPSENPEFRNNMIEFDIICHYNQWHLKNFSLRPYKIAAEIDSMLNEKELSGIGRLQFVGASQMVLTDEFAGLCLMYEAVHGSEDKRWEQEPREKQSLITNFNEMFNS